MARFKSTFQGRLFTSKFIKILAVCVASDSNVENKAFLYSQNGQRGLVFRCSELRMLPNPMHAWGQDSGPHQMMAYRCRSGNYVERFWHHARELGRWWRSAVKSLEAVKGIQ
jgi:hypothetical protein